MVDKIEGPLGIWPWPILNTIIAIMSNEDMKVTEVNRDDDGRIQSIETFRK